MRRPPLFSFVVLLLAISSCSSDEPGGADTRAPTSVGASSSSGPSITVAAGGLSVEPLATVPTSTWIRSLACPTSDYCLASDSDHRVYSLTGTDWSGLVTPPLNSVACSSATVCLSTTNLGDGGDEAAIALIDGEWRQLSEHLVQVMAVTCATDGFCLVVQSTSPEVVAFAGGTVVGTSELSFPDEQFSSAACISSTWCYAISYTTGTTVRFDGSTWTAIPATIGVSSAELSCAPDGSCFALSYEGDLFALEADAWRLLGSVGDDSFASLACTSAAECIFGTGEGSGQPGAVFRVTIRT
ncbi:MAG: hypothetical protein Q7V88_01720 [Actinomycetota bacterium]|nr:hypothetical protein [Actinomycetota bacterium]